ncbi:FadR/GntR family transcriptional regulator [Wenyingzhuangia sp. 2_MG-2023]|uniref:FadR/GntR family transcriptional regulator n=1 Tax=Wenyingzhuangia sp. 2_MG-2023 TaxID=3062639 RepID=UPI0026E43433|nr:FadR/GntR family transcriptional regulator [Wenyingzhuangia sp. 2_MG-2023]MDO6738414.1 FadR/GntR family transcriptional regulator [Wenyingzhuangia sp. 2_MG-2023]MDO6803363.1 FadR/GntR family transcriptional regulator [Wenyingzhuangia sp. 1_MG-2023]
MKLELLSKGEQTSQNEIISKLRDLINLKNLEPGDKLPSERMMSEKFEVSRSSVREVIQLLEFYGLLKSKPQSGTFVADIGQIAMNGMIDDILRLENPDFRSLVETRIMFELKTVRLAAQRRTEEHLSQIEGALEAYKEKVLNGENAVQEDLLFHLAIAQASCNSTMNTLMLMITPKIITNFEKYHVCDKNQAYIGIKEHQDIFEAIKNQDTEMAKEKMKVHFGVLYQYCYNI